jgi:hypothetical protein
MLTLSDYQNFDTNFITKGVFDWAIKQDSGFFGKLAVVSVKGNGIKYNVKTAPAAISFQDPMDDIPETMATYAQRSAALYVAVVDAYLSKFAKATNSVQNSDKLELQSKTEDFWRAIKEKFILGQTTTLGNSKQPKGLLRLLAEIETEATVDLDGLNNSQVIPMSATSAALDLASLDALIDAVANPNFLLINKSARRKLNALSRASGSPLRVEQDGFGKFISIYNGLPIFINDHIPDNIQDGSPSVLAIASYDPSHAEGSGYDNTVIFCGRSGDEGGVCINQAEPLNTEYVGIGQKKDADIYRVKWYHGYATYDKYALACLINVQHDG